MQLVSRPLYLCMMVAVPLLFSVFFLSLMDSGLPMKSPVAVVDLDDTPVSRNLVQSLDAMQLINVAERPTSYSEALDMLKEGKIYGFFMIPRGFEADAGAGRATSITYYCNMAYFIPGTMAFRTFKQTAVLTSGEIVATTLVDYGVNSTLVSNLLQPIVPQTHSIGNPWMSYTIYLGNSFFPCLLQLVIFQITAFTILVEIKRGTSRRWLDEAGGSIMTAVAGKLIPQTVVFMAVGLAIQGILYGFMGFPLQGSVWGMVGAMLLFVLASQAFGLFITSVVPNLRFALSILTLVGILAFSVAGFSYPVEHMYGGVGIFAYLLPIRYYFLIYINVALNGYEVYFCRWDYVALALFLLLPLTALWKLRRNAADPVYLP